MTTPFTEAAVVPPTSRHGHTRPEEQLSHRQADERLHRRERAKHAAARARKDTYQ